MGNHNIYMSLLLVQVREHVMYCRNEWRMIKLGSIGIPEGWVQHQDMGMEIRIELPMNWYQDDHFLGFGFFRVNQSVSHGNSVLLDLLLGERCSFSAEVFFFPIVNTMGSKVVNQMKYRCYTILRLLFLTSTTAINMCSLRLGANSIVTGFILYTLKIMKGTIACH